MKSWVFLDDKSKSLNWLNRNYFFVTTIFIVLLNIIIYAVHGTPRQIFKVTPNWSEFSVNNIFQAVVNSCSHSNWQHTLLNMLCFFIAGLYIERKKGSLKFLLFMFLLSLFEACATSTNDISISAVGFSGINYGLYSYIMIEFVCMLFQKEKRYLFNIIAGIVILCLIYFAMCFNGGTKTVSFVWYPYDLLHNLGHASGFVVGLILGIYEQACYFIDKYKSN